MAQHALAVAAQARNQADMQRPGHSGSTSGWAWNGAPAARRISPTSVVDGRCEPAGTHWARLEQDAVQLATAQAQADPITAGARP